MDDRKVKGTLVLFFVKTIRKLKELDWDKYLKPEDWEIINSLILPAKWYPFDFYRRCSLAAFDLLSKRDLEFACGQGRMLGEYLFSTTYRSFSTLNDPMRGLDQFVRMYSSLFNISSIRIDKAGPKKSIVFLSYDINDEAYIPYSKLLQGILEVTAQVSGGKNVKVEMTAKQWEDVPETQYEITWV
jgi:uncharacterized protein (TIGR02265 family)